MAEWDWGQMPRLLIPKPLEILKPLVNSRASELQASRKPVLPRTPRVLGSLRSKAAPRRENDDYQYYSLGFLITVLVSRAPMFWRLLIIIIV